jgi:GntR family phosphonate transport system transcriptional regulator
MNESLKTGRAPAWRRIEAELEQDIVSGVFAPGCRLPVEPELAARFGVNRHTVRRALAMLADRGFISIEQGRGTFVREFLLDYPISGRTRFSEIISRQHRSSSAHLLHSRIEAAPALIARDLDIAADTLCVVMETLSEVDGKPLSVVTRYFPAARFTGIDAVFRDTGSISKALQYFGVTDYFRRLTRVTARPARPADADLLQQPRSWPVLVTEAINVDTAGIPVEYGLARGAAERMQIIFNTE